jgi:hypothetical protein
VGALPSELEFDFFFRLSVHFGVSGAGLEPFELAAGRPYLEYVQSWTSPRNPERRSARARMAMPVAYVYGFIVLGVFMWSPEAENVVRTTPSVTRSTERICVDEYLDSYY